MYDFENILHGIWEYSDTTLDQTGKITRPGKGQKLYWRDICKTRTYTVGSGASAKTFEQVSGVLFCV